MKSLFPFLLVAATTMGGLWLSRAPNTQPAPSEPLPWAPALNRSQETGRRVYLRRCAWCHGKEGDGIGINAPKLETPPTDFSAPEFRRSHPKPALLDWLQGRRPRPGLWCPNWQATLAPAEMDNVADYLLALTPPANP